MQLFRTLCVVAVLGALTYGAYVTLTSSPPVPPPSEVVNWDSPPRIELPGAGAPSNSPHAPPSVSIPNGAPPQTAPKFSAAPTLQPPSAAIGGAGSNTAPRAAAGGATITGIRTPENPIAGAPMSYPTTNVSPGPFDGVGSAPLVNTSPVSAAPSTAATPSIATPAMAAPPSGSSLPGTSIAAAPIAGANTAVAPPLTPVTPAGAVGPSAAPGGATMIPSTPAGQPMASPLLEAQTLLLQNQLVAALEVLSASFDSPALSAEDDRRVMELLDQLAGSVIYSRENLLLPAHTVRPGERLDQIAAQYKTSWELLAKINGLTDPWNLPPGTQLKVLPGPFDALVDKSRRRLTLFLDGMYAGSFPIGFGRDRPPVDGQYVVGAKTANPAYIGPDLQLAADDPNNPLGERVLDLGNGQAIHGTSEPANLASDDARGCIRLSAREIEDVYDILTPGSQVIIRP